MFRAARAAGHLNVGTDANAMMLFVISLLPTCAVEPGPTGQLAAIMTLAQQLRKGGALVDDLADARELLDEIIAARPDDPRIPPSKAFADSFGGVINLVRTVAGRGGFPMADVYGLVDALPSHPSEQFTSITKVLLEEGGRLEKQSSAAPPSTRGESGDEDESLLFETLAMLVEISVPGSMNADELNRANKAFETAGEAGAWSAATAAIGRLTAAMRTNDQREMHKALENLRNRHAPRTARDVLVPRCAVSRPPVDGGGHAREPVERGDSSRSPPARASRRRRDDTALARARRPGPGPKRAQLQLALHAGLGSPGRGSARRPPRRRQC